jgi:hypothetical protein
MTTRILSPIIIAWVALSVLAICCAGSTGPALDSAELEDVWVADYDRRDFEQSGCFAIPTGTETITLRADGTYQQTYEDEYGYVFTSTWNNWYLGYSAGRHVIHLEGGRFYPLGIEDAEALAEGRLIYTNYGVWGDPLQLDGTEVVLYVGFNSHASREMYLYYPPVCDLDSPVTVEFIELDTD